MYRIVLTLLAVMLVMPFAAGAGSTLLFDLSDTPLGNVGGVEQTIGSYAVPGDPGAIAGDCVVVETVGDMPGGGIKDVRLYLDDYFRLGPSSSGHQGWEFLGKLCRTWNGHTQIRWNSHVGYSTSTFYEYWSIEDLLRTGFPVGITFTNYDCGYCDGPAGNGAIRLKQFTVHRETAG